MKDLIEALTIFAKYATEQHNPTHCEHDTFFVVCVERDALSTEDKRRVEELGFLWSEEYDSWVSFRFGSA
jgi:hypothetical protein